MRGAFTALENKTNGGTNYDKKNKTGAYRTGGRFAGCFD